MSDNETSSPVAWLDRSRTETVEGRSVALAPTLSITKAVEDVVDDIVLSVLILEHRLRETAKRADVKVASIGGVGNLPTVQGSGKMI